jgi:hypothetical protein
MKSKQLSGIATVFFIAGIALQGRSTAAAGTTDSEAVRVDLDDG